MFPLETWEDSNFLQQDTGYLFGLECLVLNMTSV
jgi:hypothetical protein